MQQFAVRIRKSLGIALLCSMGVTEILLIAQGRWKEAIPMHLCSLSGLAASVIALRPQAFLLDFLWYLGMPGAALALLFPSPAVSCLQAVMTGSYILTHALILVIPSCLMLEGMRPRTFGGARMLLVLNAAALAAAGLNRGLGTNFLFLAYPPAGTPLEAVYRMGMPAYLCMLEGIMAALCLLMEYAAQQIWMKGKK